MHGSSLPAGVLPSMRDERRLPHRAEPHRDKPSRMKPSRAEQPPDGYFTSPSRARNQSHRHRPPQQPLHHNIHTPRPAFNTAETNKQKSPWNRSSLSSPLQLCCAQVRFALFYLFYELSQKMVNCHRQWRI